MSSTKAPPGGPTAVRIDRTAPPHVRPKSGTDVKPASTPLTHCGSAAPAAARPAPALGERRAAGPAARISRRATPASTIARALSG